MKNKFSKNKNLIFSIISIFFSFILSFSAFAKNNISRIDMDVVLKNNGSATITERWTGTFDEGTEVYKPIDDQSITIRNFDVAKDGIDYKQLERWDPNLSFERKAWRYGINYTDSGQELCFGISTYGENTYAFSYDVDPIVKSYSDYDGFNFRFVNPDMVTFPTSINITLRLEDPEKTLSTDTARIWGFGFVGNAIFQDNYALAFSTEPLTGSRNATIMMRFNKGLFSPNIRLSDSFEETIEKVALQNSSYEEALIKARLEEDENERKRANLFAILQIATFVLFFFLAIFVPIIQAFRRRRTLKNFYRDTHYHRDVPNSGNIVMSHVLYKDFGIWRNKETNFLGAIIMKMINEKNLIPMQEKSYGFFGKEKINTSLKVGDPPTDPVVAELYDIIICAAGEDNILQENELKKYAKANPKALVCFIESIDSKGRTALHKANCYKKIYGKRLKDLSDTGQKELAEVFGLRKFLDEFTLISERSILEGIIWENLLVYATLFGLADKVLKELKSIYPDKLVEIENYTETVYISNIYYDALFRSSRLAQNAINASRFATMAAQGFGGSVSIGGGGGFSGGGSGGGTR